MDADRTLRRLDHHQSVIGDQMDRSVALLALPADQAHEPLAHARWIMVRMLQEYQVFKHATIFDPAIRCGTPQQVQAATRMKAECIAASEGFRTYVRQWSATDVAAHWSDYQTAMRTMAAQLRTHMAAERRAVVDLLADTARPRRLAG